MPLPGETFYVAPYVAKHSRLTTFFRGILLIPHWIVLYVYAILASISLVISWFAVVITGRYPGGLYAFNAGFLRYNSRVTAYMMLLSDVYPPFGAGADTTYPVELEIGPAKESYSRLSALIRIFPLIIVGIIQYVLFIIGFVVAVVTWFVIIVAGTLPQGLHNTLAFVTSYVSRSSVYSFLLTESFPSFDGTPKDGAVAAQPDPFSTTV